MQTTLLGLAIAFIMALLAALVGPYFIDWNQFRPQFEAEATRVLGMQVRVTGALDARLLPAPFLRLQSITVGGANDLGKVRADKLDVEFSLSSLMRGEWRATELTINGASVDLGLNAQGRIDLPTSSGRFNLGALAIDRLNLTGRVALHDAVSHSTLELSDIAFSGDVRSLAAGAVRGDGNFTLYGTRYPFRMSSGQAADGKATRAHLTIDPGERPLSVDLDGVLSFNGRAPRFDGTMIVASPVAAKPKPGDDMPPAPWRVTSKLKADSAGARLEQLETSYGPEDNAVKLAGLADIRFGASPLLHAVLSAKQLDADRLLGRDGTAKEPTLLVPTVRQLFKAFPHAPLATQIELNAEQIILGGRPVQDFSANLHGDAASWAIDKLDFRAPGATRVTFSGVPSAPSGGFSGAASIESADPDTLAAWLQGRSEVNYRSQKPLRVRGNVSVAGERFAIEALKAEIDGDAIEGRIALSSPVGDGSRFEADLRASRLDIDAATALLRSLAGPQTEWPDAGRLSLDVDRGVSAGQEMHPFLATLGYGPKAVSLDRFRIGEPTGLMLDGNGSFNRIDGTGKLALNGSCASLTQVAGWLTPMAPAIAARLNAMALAPGAATFKLALDLSRDRQKADRITARAVFDIAAPQFSGATTITSSPAIADLRSIDLDELSRGEVTVETSLTSAKGSQLLALLGLDGSVAAGDTPLRFEGAATGAWRAPLRLKAKLSGADLDADTQGTAELWGDQPKATMSVAIRRANLTPLFDLKPTDPLAQNISLSTRATLAGGQLTLDDIDGTVAGGRMRGRIALSLSGEKTVDGQLGMDAIELAPAFGLAIGARGRDATEPLGRGMIQSWRGRLAFQALRGTLPGGIELRPLSGVIKSDGQSLTIEVLKGGIGGGEATAEIDVKPGLTGVAANARVQLSNVDGAALRYRALAMPAGRASLRMTLASQGRTAFGLEGALSGDGVLSIDGARIPGLNPNVFDVAIRASDSGQAINDVVLRKIVEPALSEGTLAVASAQIPFVIKDGRLRVAATTLEAQGTRAVISGGYDIGADQADVRVRLSSNATGATAIRPEVLVFATGSPDGLNSTVDVAALSSWLAVRAIERETFRLDSLEKGRAPVALPAALPPAVQPRTGDVTSKTPSQEPPPDNALSGRDPRRVPLNPTPPRAAVVPQPSPPVVSQQLAPLPAPIEILPAPGPARVHKPRPAPPMVLTPPAASLTRPSF
ncbi:AsmA-like C-terminal region-containing protein [soil metagenome]